VGIDEPPEEQFGKVMSIPDSALDQWWRLTLDREAPAGDPMTSKLDLARGIVEIYHGMEAARGAEEYFTRVVREGEAPEDVPIVDLSNGDPVHMPALLSNAFGISTSEARRLIAQGGVRVNGEAVTDLDLPRATLAGALVQAGKRRYARLTVP
jgi:tyrosyl-tRNA synthetase